MTYEHSGMACRNFRLENGPDFNVRQTGPPVRDINLVSGCCPDDPADWHRITARQALCHRAEISSAFLENDGSRESMGVFIGALVGVFCRSVMIGGLIYNAVQGRL
jgi:hypothetical protein